MEYPGGFNASIKSFADMEGAVAAATIALENYVGPSTPHEGEFFLTAVDLEALGDFYEGDDPTVALTKFLNKAAETSDINHRFEVDDRRQINWFGDEAKITLHVS